MANPETNIKKAILSEISLDETSLIADLKQEMTNQTWDFARYKDRLHALGAISKLSLALEMIGVKLAYIHIDEIEPSPVRKARLRRRAFEDDRDIEGEQWKVTQPESTYEICAMPPYKIPINLPQTLSEFLAEFIAYLDNPELDVLYELCEEVEGGLFNTFIPQELRMPPICYCEANALRTLDTKCAITLDHNNAKLFLDSLIIGEGFESLEIYCKKHSKERNPFFSIFDQLSSAYRQKFKTDHPIPFLNRIFTTIFSNLDAVQRAESSPNIHMNRIPVKKAITDLGF